MLCFKLSIIFTNISRLFYAINKKECSFHVKQGTLYVAVNQNLSKDVTSISLSKMSRLLGNSS